MSHGGYRQGCQQAHSVARPRGSFYRPNFRYVSTSYPASSSSGFQPARDCCRASSEQCAKSVGICRRFEAQNRAIATARIIADRVAVVAIKEYPADRFPTPVKPAEKAVSRREAIRPISGNRRPPCHTFRCSSPPGRRRPLPKEVQTAANRYEPSLRSSPSPFPGNTGESALPAERP